MSTLIINVIYALIHIFGSYVSYRMIKVFNRDNVKNRKIEIISFISFYFINLYMSVKINNPFLILLISGLSFFALSFNYKSAIRKKLVASFYTLVILLLAEIVVGLLVGESMTETMGVSIETLHILLSCKIIEYVTIAFIGNLNYQGNLRKITYLQWYIPLVIITGAAYADIIVQTGTLPFRQVFLAILIVLYMLSSYIFLYIKQHKERELIIQEKENYLHQYELLYTASHTLVEVQNNLRNHVTVLKDLAEGNDKILSYLNKISQDIVLMEECIETGNQIMDIVINTKISEAKSKGITVTHEIFIPMNIKVDGYIMTIILETLFDAAIEELEVAQNKNLNFYMRYDKGHILIWFIHSDEVPTEIRKKNKYTYRNDFRMKGVKKVVKKYQGYLKVEIKDKRVEAFVSICVVGTY